MGMKWEIPLSVNYPEPFNSMRMFRFMVIIKGKVRIDILSAASVMNSGQKDIGIFADYLSLLLRI
jgi:hypothetical protein